VPGVEIKLAPDGEMLIRGDEAVALANSHLSRVEQVRKFQIVPGDWAPGGDELTPTLKLKRKPIGEKYATAIEAMYTT
jgi:long-subunit acyl-CoA synthetase (AMP-forming)